MEIIYIIVHTILYTFNFVEISSTSQIHTAYVKQLILCVNLTRI